MLRTRKEKIQDFLLNLIRYFALVWMRIDAKTTYTLQDGFSFKRTEPYLLLSSHAFVFDVIHVQKRFKIAPYTVASESLFAKQPTKFLFNNLLHGIPKSKGASDLGTARKIFKCIKRGYPVLIYPEGDITFFGETNYIEESTYKLAKKLNVDIITCVYQGGYLTRPRWATSRRKNRQVHLQYNVAIKKEELKKLSLQEVEDRIKASIYHNDYEYQRTHMISRPSKRLAEGFENVAYICPECEGVNTIVTDKNEIKCTNCNTVGYMNEFGFIEGFTYDNLVDWNHYQKPLSYKLQDSEFSSKAILYHADYNVINKKRKKVGKITITYKDKSFVLSGAKEEVIPFDKIKYPTITLRRMFNFTYNETSYIVKLESHVMAFLRVIQQKY